MLLSRLLKSTLLAATVFSVSTPILANAEPRPFTYKDLVSLDRISAFAVSPDERWMVFQVRATDLEKNKGAQSLWIKDLNNPATPERPLLVGKGAVSPQWDADGSLYFLSAKSGTMQLYRTDITGEAATAVTALPLDIEAYRLLPNGSGAVVGVRVGEACHGDEMACTVSMDEAAKSKVGQGTVYTKLFVRHWDTWSDEKRNHLFFVKFGPEASATATSLTDDFDGDVPSKPFGDEADFAISPDSQSVYFSGRVAGVTEPWSTNFDLFKVDLTAPTVMTNLTASNPAWDAHPRLSPDGKLLAYKAMKRPGFEADRFGVMILDLATGKTHEIAPNWGRSAEILEWSKDGKSLLLTADDMGSHRLFRMDVKTGQVATISGDGHMDGFAQTKGGMIFAKSGLSGPSQLYKQGRDKSMFVDATAQPLTAVNKDRMADLKLGSFEQFSFKGWNNETVYGYVVKPANYEAGKKYPIAFLIHGGPQGSFGEQWSYRWNAQSYAGEGFAVVMIDFHGSTGYGQGFTDAISEHWGDRPLEDLQKGYAHALKTYDFLDADRACALGASYGGFMINWIAGNWKEPWDCLVNHDGIFDVRTMAEETEELWFSEWENGGAPYTNMAKMDVFNPALHAKDWSVPMLVIHSDLDYRVVPGQGIATFTALQRQGIKSKFLRFPNENHWVLKPQNSLQWHTEVMSWLKENTKE